MLDRRSFLAFSGAAGAFAAPSVRAAARAGADPLRDGLIINVLGEIRDPNQPPSPNAGVAQASFTRRAVIDARAAGVTAINITVGHVFGDSEPFEETVRAIAQWDEVIRRNSGDLLKVFSTADIRRAKAERKIGVIYGFQNASMMGERADRVDVFADLGVRVIQLTYNASNRLGGGALAGELGLTPFGHEVVERLNARRVIVDLAHSGERICLDAARASKQPVAISHTGCRALTDVPRNKTDEELRLVASRGGFVGIYFMPFLAMGRNATREDVVRHVEHAVDVCGEDHVGIGTDGPITPIDDLTAYQAELAQEHAARRAAGIAAPGEAPGIMPFVQDLRGPDQFRQLADVLAKRGHSAARIEKILGSNFVRFAREVWAS